MWDEDVRIETEEEGRFSLDYFVFLLWVSIIMWVLV